MYLRSTRNTNCFDVLTHIVMYETEPLCCILHYSGGVKGSEL